MRDLLDALDRWRREGTAMALARVVDLDGSGPRGPGAAMAVNQRGEVVGSVSGGCVEGAVVAEALDILGATIGSLVGPGAGADSSVEAARAGAGSEAEPRSVAGSGARVGADVGASPVAGSIVGVGRMVTFGYSDDEAFAVGLTCGGTIHLFVEPFLAEPPDRAVYDELAAAIRSEEPVALATVTEGPGRGAKLLVRPGIEPLGSLGDPNLDRVVARDALGELAAGTTRLRHYGPHGEAREQMVAVFVESFAPPPRMFIFGAVDFTVALCRVAKVLGYRVTVCDAREVFATRARFPEADEVVVDWPDRLLGRLGPTLTARDAVCVLTHEAKFDVPALVAALGTEAGYVGAMGSRLTHADRARRLSEAGLDPTGLARIRAPIGLDLGARTPEETAVSICAEIIAGRTGRSEARPLSQTTGPIHTQPSSPPVRSP